MQEMPAARSRSVLGFAVNSVKVCSIDPPCTASATSSSPGSAFTNASVTVRAVAQAGSRDAVASKPKISRGRVGVVAGRLGALNGSSARICSNSVGVFGCSGSGSGSGTMTKFGLSAIHTPWAAPASATGSLSGGRVVRAIATAPSPMPAELIYSQK